MCRPQLEFIRKQVELPRKGLVEMLSFLIIFGVTLAILDIAALLFGVDSRDGEDWFTHRTSYQGGQR